MIRTRSHGAEFARSLGVFALIAVAALASAGEALKEEPKPAWRTGPVRYILSPEEDKGYKALKTDEDRTKAIEAFWLRRDPTPGTPANEYREGYFGRVEEANSLFRGDSGLGWTTDRGKLYLIAGAPQFRTGAGEERETWTYSFALGKEQGGGKPSSFKVVFQKDESGEYRMSSEGAELISRIQALDRKSVV
jgi:GWxTD domain-containing protein